MATSAQFQPQYQYRFIGDTNVSTLASVAKIKEKEREIRVHQAAFNGHWVDGMPLPESGNKLPPPITKRDNPQNWTEEDVLRGPLKWTSIAGVVTDIMSFLLLSDVLKCQRVSKHWQQCSLISVNVHYAVRPIRKFRWKYQLVDAVRQYCSRDPEHMDRIASTYGYPINCWNVSQITSFNEVFRGQTNFNEPIHDWDTSNATKMSCMFEDAQNFNQDIS